MNCLKYGNKIYKPEILFDKIRKNPAFFAKKHNINGYDIEQVLGIPHKDISNTEYQYLKESDFDSDGNIRPEVLAEIKAERESIIKQAQANGSYMKAPNGQPTKLNKDQWVTVRTQRFKEWFGDWEKSTRIEKLKNSKPIKIAFNNEYELNRDSVKAWVLNNLRNEYTIDDTGETISLTKVGANKVTSHGIGNEAHLKSIANIPNLIKNAIFIEEKSNEKGNDKYDSYRYYVLGSELNGEPYTIKLTIGVKQGKKYYDHSLTQIEKGKLIDQINDQSVKKSFKTTGDAPLQPSSLSGVKDTKLVSILQNNSSKVVDENGEPMVVYHGARSTEQFNVFNEVKNGIYFSSNKEVAEAFKNENAYVLTINGEDFVLDKDSANALKDEVEPYWDIETMIGYNLAEDFADNINEALNNGALQIGFNEEVSNEDIIELKENTNPFFETFLNIRNPKTIDFNNEPWGGKEGTIEENLDKSKDGFIAENIIEGGLVSELPSSTTYVVFLPNQIKSATDNVGTFDSGNDDIRYQIVGEKGARNLDNIEESTHRMDNLAIAKDMETNGKDSESIWLATGWEKGADNKWRYEIPDLDISRETVYDETGKPITVPTAKQWFEYHNRNNESLQPLYLKDFKPTEEEIDKAEFLGYELSKIMDIYPELGEIRIIIHPKEKSMAEAFYSPKLKLISLREDSRSFHKYFIHELQHAIQKIEGFSKGGNIKQFSDITARQKANELTTEAQAIFDKQSEDWKNKIRAINRAKIDKDFDQAQTLEEAFYKNETNESIQIYEKYDNLMFEARYYMEEPDKVILDSYDQYHRLAGEVEARNTENRINLSEEERREKPLSSTEDVARREQTLRYSDGTQEANKQNKFIPPHQGVAPSSLLNAIKKKFEETNGNKAEAYKVLTQSHWYNELDTAEQNKITEKGIIDFLFDQVEKFKENKKVKTEWDKEQQLKADEQYRNDNLYNKSDEELLNDEYKAMEETDKKLRNKKPWISKEGVKKFITKVSDRQFNVKRIAMKLGMENTRNRIIAMAGASAKSKREAEAVHNSIFKGLTFEEKKDLNLIITHRRNIAIDENREARGLPQIRHQRGHTKATSTKVLGAIKNRIGEKSFAELDKRASLYFDEFKKVLGSQLKAGLISQQQYDSMIDIDYQPRLFVEHLLDAEGNLMENSKEYQQNNKLGREMIKTLSDGSFGDQVIDAEWLFKMTIGARNSQLFMNDLNQTFATRDFPQAKREYDALMKKPKAQWTKEERNIAKYFEQLQSKVKFPTKKTEDTPKGYRKAYYYENGELKFFFMEEKFYDEWYDIQKGLFANPDVKEKVTKWSGSSLVKLAATGLNSAFVITNTPKDFVQIVMFSPEYSNNSVWATMQLAKDATKGVMELIKDDMGNKDTLLAKYIEYGGGMDFLHTQGLGERDNGVAKALEKVLPPKFRDRFLFGLNTISLLKLSRYSETMFRLGVFSRSMKNQLKEYNKVNGTNYKSVEEIPNETTKRDMYIGAVASARSVLDFNQGGTITKDMEAFVPYINAGVQGARVAVDAFTQRPKQTSIRLLQAGAFFGGIGAGMSALLFSLFDDDDEEDKRSAMEKILHAYDGLSEHQRINYFNIVLPEKLENGEYRVIKISKTQAITPLAYLMEEMLLNHFRKDKDKRGAKEILKGVGLAFNQNLTPIALPTGTKATDIGQAGANVIVRTPIIKAVVSANTGWDFFRNQPLDPLTAGKKLPMELEGIKNDKVEDFYKAFGELSQDSPVRVKAMVESFITSPDTNPFITFTYSILEGIAREGSFTDNFSEYFLDEKQGGILRRGLSETKDYNRTIRSKERTQEEVDRMIVKSEKEREKLKTLAEDYANGKIEKQDIKDAISEMTDNPKIREKYFNRVKDQVNKGDTDPMIWEIKYGTGNSDEAKAYLIKQHYGSYEEVNTNKEIRSQLKENGVFSEAIQRELKKLGK